MWTDAPTNGDATEDVDATAATVLWSPLYGVRRAGGRGGARC